MYGSSKTPPATRPAWGCMALAKDKPSIGSCFHQAEAKPATSFRTWIEPVSIKTSSKFLKALQYGLGEKYLGTRGVSTSYTNERDHWSKQLGSINSSTFFNIQWCVGYNSCIREDSVPTPNCFKELCCQVSSDVWGATSCLTQCLLERLFFVVRDSYMFDHQWNILQGLLHKGYSQTLHP